MVTRASIRAMLLRTLKTVTLLTLTCVLTGLTFKYLVNKTHRETNLNQDVPISTNTQPVTLEKGLQYLPESEFVKDKRKFDVKGISIGKYSKISLSDKKLYTLGEDIKVKITLYNARGEKMSRGGDYLRLWMGNGKIKAAVSGTVLDNNDGTYSGTVRAMWSGEAVIGAMILGRREEIALIYKLYSKFHMVWYNYAEFTNGMVEESSECSVAPFSINRKWCNLTANNAGFPWFCVKPEKPGLSCNMWYRQWSMSTARPYDNDSSATLKKLWPMSKKTDLLQRTTQQISGRSDRIIPPDTPCNKIAPEVTWNRKPPKGFFYKSQWHSTQCTDTMKHTPTAYKECLRGRTLYLHGDSTAKNFLDSLNTMLGYPAGYVGWHLPEIRKDVDYNLTLSWHAHELPFYHGRVHYDKSVNRAQHIVLDKIPSNSRDIIVLYLYVHFTLNHPDVFRQHVQKLVQSVQKLISRAPGVTIAVRGPHAFRKMERNQLLHSYWGLHYMDTLHKEFAPLRKHVLYLDYWDMTMARIPDNMHVERKMVTKMVGYMMSIVCHRN